MAWYNELTGETWHGESKPISSGPWRYCDKWYEADAMGKSIRERNEQQKKNEEQNRYSNNSNNSANPSGSGSTLLGAAIGGGASLIGFGLKGIWKILIFPLWLLFIIFKGLFYTFPRFLWKKGKVGRIILVIYISAWVVAIGIQMIINYVNEKNAIEYVVKESSINIFADDSSESITLESIPEGSTILILKQNQETGWAKVKFEYRTGYVRIIDLNIQEKQEGDIK